MDVGRGRVDLDDAPVGSRSSAKDSHIQVIHQRTVTLLALPQSSVGSLEFGCALVHALFQMAIHLLQGRVGCLEFRGAFPYTLFQLVTLLTQRCLGLDTLQCASAMVSQGLQGEQILPRKGVWRVALDRQNTDC